MIAYSATNIDRNLAISGEQMGSVRKKDLFKARPYQVEIANVARNENCIVKLNTGLGKTFIAVMVIKEHLPETYRPLAQGGKRILFVAKTGTLLSYIASHYNNTKIIFFPFIVHLVYQHAEFLRKQLPVASNEIGLFHGQIAPGVWIDSWGQVSPRF